MSCMLVLTSCAQSLPPCDRSDLIMVHDDKGQLIMGVKESCFDRMLRDLDACYSRQ